MIASEDTSKIIPALVAALGDMEDITKTRTADIPTKAGGKFSYKYADLHDVLGYARPLLKAHGLAVFQEPFTDGNGTSVSTTFLHTSGQWIESRPLRLPAQGDAQSHGSAISFARRYQLLAQLGLATEDDDGAAASKAPKPQRKASTEPGDPRPANAITAAQLTALGAGFTDLGITDRDERLGFVVQAIGRPIDSSKELTKSEASRVFDAITERKQRNSAA